jgi:hypothetical protein
MIFPAMTRKNFRDRKLFRDPGRSGRAADSGWPEFPSPAGYQAISADDLTGHLSHALTPAYDKKSADG